MKEFRGNFRLIRVEVEIRIEIFVLGPFSLQVSILIVQSLILVKFSLKILPSNFSSVINDPGCFYMINEKAFFNGHRKLAVMV